MFKRLIAFTTLTALLMSAASGATGAKGLARAYAELNYALNVDAQATDPAFRQAAQVKFLATVEELKAAGMTQQEMADFAVSQASDKQLAQNLSDALKAIEINDVSGPQAIALVKDAMVGESGASWNGEEVVYGVILVLLVAALVATYIETANLEEEGQEDEPNCNDYGFNPEFMLNPFCMY